MANHCELGEDGRAGDSLEFGRPLKKTPRESKAGDVTQLLQRWSAGDPDAHRDLMDVVYDELRGLAKAYLRRERGPDLQATTLVHDVYLKLIDQKRVRWRNRAHFFGIAAQAMRRILVDRAREANAEKRGGGTEKLALDEALTLAVERSPELIALDEALDELAGIQTRAAKAVELHYFAGMTYEEIAEVIGTSVPTVTRDLRTARKWLYRELSRRNNEAA